MKFKKRLLWLLPALLWLGVMFFFSGQDSHDSAALSGAFTKFLMDILPVSMSALEFEHLLRKAAHFTIFAVGGFLLMFGLGQAFGPGLKRFVIAVLGYAAVAVANELHQLTSVGRSCSHVDMLIDFTGALTGILIAALLLRLTKRRGSN